MSSLEHGWSESLLRERPFVTVKVSEYKHRPGNLTLTVYLEQSVLLVELKDRCHMHSTPCKMTLQKLSLFATRKKFALQFSRGKSRHLLRSVPSLLLSLIPAFWRALCT